MEQKVTVIATVFNEENSIESFLNSLCTQTRLPDEIVIVDGGSTDRTIELIKNFKFQISNFKLKIIIKKGNRSVGRNTAIQNSSYDLIAITDAGCIPHRDWLHQLLLAHKKTKAPVIAGYYDAKPKTHFEEAVIPYALVMPDRLNAQTFLPATRSMMIEKKAWESLGGFDESLYDNEDYAFAQKLKKNNIAIEFNKNAKVTWIPRSNIHGFIKMIYRFAKGDAYAGIFRPKVVFIFIRYLLGLALLAYILYSKNYLLFTILYSLFLFYLLWAIFKNKHYVPHGWYYLPLLQVVSDVAVISGTIKGIWDTQNR